MILVVFGTTGELIKLAPVLLRLDERGHRVSVRDDRAAGAADPGFLEQFGLRQPDLWLARGARGRDLRVTSDIPRWVATVMRSWLRERRTVRRALREGPGPPAPARSRGHDDDGARQLIGRSLRSSVAHIEGGLRSYDLRHPFPEELNRKARDGAQPHPLRAGCLGRSNLRGGEVVDTGSNTIRDSLELVSDEPPPVALPGRPFGIVSLHRFELLNNRRLLTETIEVLAEAARPDTAALHRPSGHDRRARAFRVSLVTSTPRRFMRIPRLRFFDFVRVERRSAFVVTDSGGSQEECYYLDLPCLVHRVKTERREGLGENAVLSGMGADVLRDFLGEPVVFAARRTVARVAVGCDRRRPRATGLRVRSRGRLTTDRV